MPRTTRSNTLENRTQRLRLTARTKPYTQKIAPTIHVGYRRNDTSSGSWSVIVKRHPEWMRKFATADDFEPANGETVLTYQQAVEKALGLARHGEGNSGAMATVMEAVEAYESDLETAGRSTYNASTLRKQHLPAPAGGQAGRAAQGARSHRVVEGDAQEELGAVVSRALRQVPALGVESSGA